MATQNALTRITMVAGSDLSSSQFFFVKLAADGQIDAAGDGEAAEGVLINKPSAAGDAATVVIEGLVQVKAGTGGLTVGDNVASDASGNAVTAASGDIVLGKAMQTVSANEFGQILFTRPTPEPI